MKPSDAVRQFMEEGSLELIEGDRDAPTNNALYRISQKDSDRTTVVELSPGMDPDPSEVDISTSEALKRIYDRINEGWAAPDHNGTRKRYIGVFSIGVTLMETGVSPICAYKRCIKRITASMGDGATPEDVEVHSFQEDDGEEEESFDDPK